MEETSTGNGHVSGGASDEERSNERRTSRIEPRLPLPEIFLGPIGLADQEGYVRR